jgi:N-acetylglutamate synthase-like GNAT family acetyltransferase
MTISIRPFGDSDAETVFKLRAEAFVTQFFDELGPERCAAGINAYMPSDYRRMAKEMKFFIAEEDGRPVGFYTLKLDDPATAELLFIYIDTKNLRRGIGAQLIQHSESWIRNNWPDVRTYVVDTGIPKYNGDFYRRMGFSDAGNSKCPFPDLPIPALRLSKSI